jgi:hypothetical protein
MPINIKSPIEYFPLKVGNTELQQDKHNFSLYDGVETWMGYDTQSNWQACEFFIEVELAYGKCVTTGLGLGILQTLLALKDNVTEVIVYERNPDVIEIFKLLTKKSNIDISKITIINEDANNIKDITCDCLFLDHFENEPLTLVLETVKNIASRNKANIVWFWPAYHIFVRHCASVGQDINIISFSDWVATTNINNFPNQISPHLIDELIEFIDTIWPEQKKYNIELIKKKNKLIKMFKRKK